MTKNIEQASFEAALKGSACNQEAQVGKGPLSIQQRAARGSLSADCQTTGAVSVLSPLDGEGDVETADLG